MQPYRASNRIGTALDLDGRGERERLFGRVTIDRDLDSGDMDGGKQLHRDAIRLGSHLLITHGAVLSVGPVEPSSHPVRPDYPPASPPGETFG